MFGCRLHKGRVQTERQTAHAGSRLKPLTIREGTAWKASPPAVLGGNPPYGMIGGIEETSASFDPTPIAEMAANSVIRSPRRPARAARPGRLTRGPVSHS